MWRSGAITAAHEHFATAAIKVFLGSAARQFGVGDSAPAIVVATPAGQIHEMGAVIVGAAAANQGWRVTYLGVSLPAAELAGAVAQNRARALALSIVYPEDDPNLPAELLAIRRLLPDAVQIAAGGRAAQAYAETLDKIGAVRMGEMNDLYAFLDRLRSTATRADR
jgi:methanogenic corrinoid protein MtbC1